VWLTRSMSWIKTISETLSIITHYIGGAVIFLLMLLTFANVCLRYFSLPIAGSLDISELMLAVIIFFTLSYTVHRKRHIAIEVVMHLFPQRAQAVVDCFNYIVSVGVSSLIAWQLAVQAKYIWTSGSLAGVLPIPIFPFYYVGAAGFVLIALSFFVQFLEAMHQAVKR